MVFGDKLLCMGKDKISWNSAKEKCASYSSNLVTITSQEKEDFIGLWALELINSGIIFCVLYY